MIRRTEVSQDQGRDPKVGLEGSPSENPRCSRRQNHHGHARRETHVPYKLFSPGVLGGGDTPGVKKGVRGRRWARTVCSGGSGSGTTRTGLGSTPTDPRMDTGPRHTGLSRRREGPTGRGSRDGTCEDGDPSGVGEGPDLVPTPTKE